ncbi:hypothetical protein ACFLYY_00770 [Patescibacteria group bacterium]
MKEQNKLFLKIYGFIYLGFFFFVLLIYFLGRGTGDIEVAPETPLLVLFLFPLITSLINGTAIILATILIEKVAKIYKWQKIIIWIIAILTTLSVLGINSLRGSSFIKDPIAFTLDLFFGIFLNILALVIIFLISNWVYKKLNNKPSKEIEINQTTNQSINYCPSCGLKINNNPNFCPNCGEKL